MLVTLSYGWELSHFGSPTQTAQAKDNQADVLADYHPHIWHKNWLKVLLWSRFHWDLPPVWREELLWQPFLVDISCSALKLSILVHQQRGQWLAAQFFFWLSKVVEKSAFRMHYRPLLLRKVDSRLYYTSGGHAYVRFTDYKSIVIPLQKGHI